MVSTFGLQRLETGLQYRPIPADPVERAKETTRPDQQSFKLNTDEPGLPTREYQREYALEYTRARPNPQFQRTRCPDPV